jgi:hypothetical protein
MPENKKEYRYKEVSEDMSSKNRFWVGADDEIFMKADPLTDEERAEAAAIWDAMTGGKAAPGKVVPNRDTSHLKPITETK